MGLLDAFFSFAIRFWKSLFLFSRMIDLSLSLLMLLLIVVVVVVVLMALMLLCFMSFCVDLG